jgi:hypothetical protein
LLFFIHIMETAKCRKFAPNTQNLLIDATAQLKIGNQPIDIKGKVTPRKLQMAGGA